MRVFLRSRRSFVVVLLSAGLSACADPRDADSVGETSSALAAMEKGGRFVPRQAIVKLRGGAMRDLGPSVLGKLHAETVTPDFAVVALEASAPLAAKDDRTATLELLRELGARADVEYAHPNWIFELSAVPSDPLYSRQWSAPLIGLPAAWDITRGSPMTRIAIIDTGRTAYHADLNAKWVSGVEYDAYAQDGDATAEADYKWAHGVAVAGVAGGAANNWQGIAGACQECQLLNVKVVGPLEPTADAVLRGLQWSLDNGANVVNMSFELNGLACADPQMRAFYDLAMQAASRNVVLVAAAGNTGVSSATVVPASCPGVIAVAASDRNNRLAAYSNRDAVTLTAPGGGASLEQSSPPIMGPEGYGTGVGCPADPSSNFGTSESGVFTTWSTSGGTACYRYLAGTSLAAPHVAGVVGLMLSRNPGLTPSQVRSILQNTATPMPECGGQCGAGLLNAEAAVRQAAPLPVGDAAPTARFTFQCYGLQCTLDGRGSTDDRGIISYQWRFPGQQVRTGPVMTFFMPGYNADMVELRVTDSSGQSSSTTQWLAPSQGWVTPYRGSYANPQRAGHTLDFFHNDSNDWYVTWYTYRADGTPIWYISDTGQILGSTWSAVLYRANWTGSGASVTAVGSVGLAFSGPSEAWFRWTLDGASGGERVAYRGGGWGRSAAWYPPAESGWGFSTQEMGANLEATYSFYADGGAPMWMRGTMSAGPYGSMQLVWYRGLGLCPGCGGKEPPRVDVEYAGTANISIPTSDSTTGWTAIDVSHFVSYSVIPVWRRLDVPVSRLTSL